MSGGLDVKALSTFNILFNISKEELNEKIDGMWTALGNGD